MRRCDMTADTTGRVRPTARQRARAEITGEIKDEARRQLATTGAQLSLRAVARELGMVSSALYRYFPSRDDLLTALIIDAYDAAGHARPRRPTRRRRPGRRDRPGPVAGLLPRDPRLGAGQPARVRADLRLPGAGLPRAAGHHRARRAGRGGAGRPAGRRRPTRGGPSSRCCRGAAGGAGRAGRRGGRARRAGPTSRARGLVAWTQLFGMISFELFGQLVGTRRPGRRLLRLRHRPDGHPGRPAEDLTPEA